MELMKNTKIAAEVLPCYLIPFGVDEQFHGRLDILEKTQNGLRHENGALKVKCIMGNGRRRQNEDCSPIRNKFR
jgi:hypothetical protein